MISVRSNLSSKCSHELIELRSSAACLVPLVDEWQTALL